MNNTTSALITSKSESLSRILSAALSGLSPNTCRAYTRHLTGFLAHTSTFDREQVVKHLSRIPLTDTPKYNQALSAIKRLASEAAENGWIDWTTARAISGIPARKLRGDLTGNWLTGDQASALLSAPPDTLIGKRDKAVLALFLGTGLRREELTRLTLDQIQTRENRRMIVNLRGKGNRIRSVAIPVWADKTINQWTAAAGITSGILIRSFTSNGTMNGSVSVSTIWLIVERYAKQCKLTCTPHDLRRTFAKLARKNNAPLEVIQKSLGHSSISTTERYMNTGEESNAGDYFEL